MAELVVAVAILTIALLPLAYSYVNNQRLLRHAHHRAAALELVDGEAEVLAAGALLKFPPGESTYPMPTGAITNLPAGRFILVRTDRSGTLTWQPDRPLLGGGVRREFHLLPPTGGLRAGGLR